MTYVPLREPWAKQREALALLEGREFFEDTAKADEFWA